MKKFLPLVLLGSVLCFVFMLQGCLKDKITRTYVIFTPIYQTKETVKANIKSNPSRNIEAPGKIFIYNNYVFLNEVDKGVHIIDNTDPSNPVVKAFIDIPGNIDIAVKGNTLYADMYGDLVAVDITDPLHAKLLKTLPNVFPERSYSGGFVSEPNMVIVGWKKETVTEEVKPSPNYMVFAADNFGLSNAAGPTTAASAPVGIGGSMARFTIVNDYLYAVDHHTLHSISISNVSDPKKVATTSAGFDIETIYPLKDKLFVGSMGGLYIFDISNPSLPVSMANFVHARACDPVIADGNYAYVTLRAGTTCGPTVNELQVVDIKDITAPLLFKKYSMTNPSGLSKDGTTLFICDGKDGLKIYNASDVANLQLTREIKEIEPSDVIAWNHNALVVTKDGLYQYDYSDLNNIHLRSKLAISK